MSLSGLPLESVEPVGSLQLARRGDLAAFDSLMRAQEPRVFSLALRFTGRRADAEELTQDVFLLLHASLAQISDEAHLRRWLLRAVTHRCLNRLRDDKRRPTLVSIDALPAEAEPAAESHVPDPMAGAKLRRLVLELSPEARAVLLLRYQEDLDPSDIATVLAMSINTVKSHLRRSLEWLRGQIGGDDRGT
jgi:RNA polymerase sigma-70 factor (ECF subfamily)